MSSGVGNRYSPWHEMHGGMACCACTPWLRHLSWSAGTVRRPKPLSMLRSDSAHHSAQCPVDGDWSTSDRAFLVDPFHGFAFVAFHSRVTICDHGLCLFCSLHLARWRKPYGLNASTSAETIKMDFRRGFPLSPPQPAQEQPHKHRL